MLWCYRHVVAIRRIKVREKGMTVPHCVRLTCGWLKFITDATPPRFKIECQNGDSVAFRLSPVLKGCNVDVDATRKQLRLDVTLPRYLPSKLNLKMAILMLFFCHQCGRVVALALTRTKAVTTYYRCDAPEVTPIEITNLAGVKPRNRCFRNFRHCCLVDSGNVHRV